MLGSLSFEKGKIELKIDNYTENDRTESSLRKADQKHLPHRKHILKYFPKSTLALLSIGINGEEFYNVLQENRAVPQRFLHYQSR